MTGMSRRDANTLCERLETALPDKTVELGWTRASGPNYLCVHVCDRMGNVLATFYDLPFGNTFVSMTPEPQAKEAH